MFPGSLGASAVPPRRWSPLPEGHRLPPPLLRHARLPVPDGLTRLRLRLPSRRRDRGGPGRPQRCRRRRLTGSVGRGGRPRIAANGRRVPQVYVLGSLAAGTYFWTNAMNVNARLATSAVRALLSELAPTGPAERLAEAA